MSGPTAPGPQLGLARTGDGVLHVIWNRGANLPFINNITGIGRDDGDSLVQRQSRSINTTKLVTIYHGNYNGNTFPTLTTPLVTCAPSQLGSTRIRIPAPGTEDDDHNPPRIAARHLFDASVGHDNIFHGERYKVSLRVTAINLTNKVALYNFLSTFSGTHFVTPRTESVELAFHF